MNKNCFAIWYTPKISSGKREPLKIDLHLNLWKLPLKKNILEKIIKKKNDAHFLDIGLRIKETSNVRDINIFIPFLVLKKEIEDLGSYFDRCNELVAVIFNEKYKVERKPETKILTIKDDDDEVRYNIYILDIKNDVRVKHKYHGTIISIKIKDTDKLGKFYYRIRINAEGVKGALSTIFTPQSYILENINDNTELVDLRINEIRNLDKSLLEEIYRKSEIRLEKTDLFIMREFKYDYISSHKNLYRSRLLEPDIWNLYVKDDCECQNIVAYQWQYSGVTRFNAFVKYRFVTSNALTIIRFILIIILIGIVGGLIGNLVYNCFWGI